MPKQSSTEIEVIVTVHEGHLSQIKEVAEQLRAMGLQDINILGSIGAITGRVSSGLIGPLQGISGVFSVEPSRTVHIAPPESDIQ